MQRRLLAVGKQLQSPGSCKNGWRATGGGQKRLGRNSSRKGVCGAVQHPLDAQAVAPLPPTQVPARVALLGLIVPGLLQRCFQFVLQCFCSVVFGAACVEVPCGPPTRGYSCVQGSGFAVRSGALSSTTANRARAVTTGLVGPRPGGCFSLGGACTGPVLLFERGGGVGTRPRYLIVCLWRRLSASRHCSF